MGLSSNSSSAVGLAPGFADIFFQPPAGKTHSCEDISYLDALHGGEISVFEKSSEFKPFREKYIAQLACLTEFAKANNRDADTVKEVKDAFETLERRLFGSNDDFYGNHKKALYGAGKRALDKLSSLVHNDALRLDQRLDAVAQLARGVGACPEGAAVNLSLAANDLNLMLSGDEIYRLKEQVCRQLMLEYIKSVHAIHRSLEIHYVMFLNNILADKLGLPVYDDANTNMCREVTTEDIEGCLQHILQHLTPARLTAALADEYLSEFDNAMQNYFAKAEEGNASGNISALFSYDEFEFRLKAAFKPIEERLDKADLFDFITFENDDCKRFGINKDAMLITLKILQSLDQRNLTEGYLPETLAGFGEGNGKITIEHHNAQLIWATENRVPCLLAVEHLQFFSPDKLGDATRLVASTAIKNSSPAALLEILPSEWIKEADMSQLIPKMLGETFSPFLEKHQAAFVELPVSQRLDIAKNLVACGDVSAFKAFMANDPSLFGKHKETVEILTAFWRSAMRCKNTDMLDAVANLALEAITEHALIPPRFLNNLARTLRRKLETTSTRFKKLNDAAVFQMGHFLTKAWDCKIVTSDELANLFAAMDSKQRPALSFAMARGNSEQVSAFGNILLQAADRGALAPNQLFTLLEAANDGKSALSLALNNDHTAAVTAFGTIVLSGYALGFLDSEQVCSLMACRAEDGHGRLFASLRSVENSVVKALGDILLGIDTINLQAGDTGASATLLSPKHDDYEMLSEWYDERVFSEKLRRLHSDIKSFQSKVESGRLFGEMLMDEMDKLRVQISWNRISLFIAPKRWLLEKKNMETLFSEIVSEWDALRQRRTPGK